MSSKYYSCYGVGVKVNDIALDYDKFVEFIKNHKPALFEKLKINKNYTSAEVWDVFVEFYEAKNNCEMGPFAAIADIISEETNVSVEYMDSNVESCSAILLVSTMPWLYTEEDKKFNSESIEEFFKKWFTELGVTDIEVEMQDVPFYG